ncbi:hypothetical protein [Streptomyces melanogenes]|uniref:hypothetical protein n=1 Tax=Streptomyces melanogenes TaxID=67326 RepID=UPI00167E19A7|nr:hypothetical protein [Streptomyces melanogenes]
MLSNLAVEVDGSAAQLPAATSTLSAVTAKGFAMWWKDFQVEPSAEVSQCVVPAASRIRSHRWSVVLYGVLLLSVVSPSTTLLATGLIAAPNASAATSCLGATRDDH